MSRPQLTQEARAQGRAKRHAMQRGEGLMARVLGLRGPVMPEDRDRLIELLGKVEVYETHSKQKAS